MNWQTTIYYAQDGIDYQQVLNAPHIPRVGDSIIANFGKGVHRIMFTVESITFSTCLLYTSPSPRDYAASRMPSSA